LEEHMAVQNGYLPGSSQPIPYILETCESSFRKLSCNSAHIANALSHAALAVRRYEQGESRRDPLMVQLPDSVQRFRAYLFDSGKAPDIIGYILLISLEHKDDPGAYHESTTSMKADS
jgi:hypothetical protein